MQRSRTDSYFGTFRTTCAFDLLEIKKIRDHAKFFNKYDTVGKRYRVVLRGRKPFEKMNSPGFKGPVAYDRGGNVVGGLKNASRVDVYIYSSYK